MSASIHRQAGNGMLRRDEPAPARASAHLKPVATTRLLRHAAFTALLLYAMLVLLYPPALSGAISVPTTPSTIIDVFDLTMAAAMPSWLLFPIHTGIGDGAARAATAALILCSCAPALRGA